MVRTIVAGYAVVATTAFAQVSPLVNERPQTRRGDPDQIVCMNVTQTGSRLSTRRVCRTRAEWDEHRAQSRLVTERVQNFKPSCTPTCLGDPRLGGN